MNGQAASALLPASYVQMNQGCVRGARMQARTIFFASLCGAVIFAAGCSSETKPSNAKFEKAINAYFENRNECLFPDGRKFPYEVTPGSEYKQDMKLMDAMKDAGLVKEQGAAAIHAEIY